MIRKLLRKARERLGEGAKALHLRARPDREGQSSARDGSPDPGSQAPQAGAANGEGFLNEEEVDRFGRWSRWTLMLAVVISTFLTYGGLNGELGMPVAAALITVFLSGVSLLVWHAVLMVYPRADATGRAGILAIALGFGAPLIVTTSSMYGGLAMMKPEAMRQAQLGLADAADTHVRELVKAKAGERTALPEVEASATELEALKQAEIESSPLSNGKKGQAGVTNTALGNLARAYRGMAKDLADLGADAEGAGTRAMEATARLRAIAEDAQANRDSMKEASQEYRLQLRALELATDELRRAAVGEGALSHADAAATLNASLPLTARTEKGRKRQKAALERVAKLGADARERARAALEGARAELPEETRWRMPEPMDAIRENLADVAHLLAIPLALDIGWPLVAVLLETFLRRRLKGRLEDEDQAEAPATSAGHPGAPALPRQAQPQLPAPATRDWPTPPQPEMDDAPHPSSFANLAKLEAALRDLGRARAR